MHLGSRSRSVFWLALTLLAACRSTLGVSGRDGAAADAGQEVASPAPDAAVDGPVADTTMIPPDVAPEIGPVPDAGAPDGGTEAGAVQCGAGGVPETTSFMDHLVVVPDGTIYFTNGGAIGRIRPGQPEENDWVAAPGGVGLTYDPRRRTLYAGLRGRLRMLVVKVSEGGEPQPTERPLGSGAGGIYGMTLGEDGAVYYLDEWNGSIYRTEPDTWTSTQVATLLPNRPHALAFGPDGWLYVTQTLGTDVWRVKLEANREVAREKFGTVAGTQGRGIAFDERGHLYVAAEGLLTELDPTGKLVQTFPSSAGGIDFGAGHLGCTTLYVAAHEGLRLHPLDVRGMNVPWHRTP